MKYLVIFLVVCVALSAAAPALIAPYAAYIAPYFPRERTLVAGPRVVNGVDSQITYPGYIGTTYF